MKKQASIKKNTPEIYAGLVQDNKNTRKCLLLDDQGRFSRFDSKAQLEKLQSYEALIKPTIDKVWANFDEFVVQTNEQTMLAYHEQLFGGKLPPKKQDLITTKLIIWHKMMSLIKNDMTVKESEGSPKDPVSGRKSSIATRKYFLGEVKEGSADITTYQALKCLELIRVAISEEIGFIEEAELKQYIIDHAEVLKTKQDPWRIFQYYRPQLIKAKLIKHD